MGIQDKLLGAGQAVANTVYGVKQQQTAEAQLAETKKGNELNKEVANLNAQRDVAKEFTEKSQNYMAKAKANIEGKEGVEKKEAEAAFNAFGGDKRTKEFRAVKSRLQKATEAYDIAMSNVKGYATTPQGEMQLKYLKGGMSFDEYRREMAASQAKGATALANMYGYRDRM